MLTRARWPLLLMLPALSLCAGQPAAGSTRATRATRPITDDAINRVIGDESWIAQRGVPPGPAAGELERITTHLAHVEQRLRAHEPAQLSAEQRRERLRLLDALADYRRAGVFPRNDVLPKRSPRFIDPAGRACAVAHLMRVAGDGALASAVNAQHEWSYVRDIHDPALDHWASAHGFTAHELAMIQPAYGPPRPPPRPGQAALNRLLGALEPKARACVTAEKNAPANILITIDVDWPVAADPAIEVSSKPTSPPIERCVAEHAKAALSPYASDPRIARGPAVKARVSFRVRSQTKPQPTDN